MKWFKDNDGGIHFYTGSETYHKFLFVLRTLGDAVDELDYIYGKSVWIEPLNQFLFTFMILRSQNSLRPHVTISNSTQASSKYFYYLDKIHVFTVK